MMSSQTQPIEFSSLDMINRVLARAGYRGTAAEVDARSTTEAATYLLDKFHEGASSEDELTALLDRRGLSSVEADATPAQVKAEALDRWQDEGGAQSPYDQPSVRADEKVRWRGQPISGALGVGAVIFISSEEQDAGSAPEPSDRLRLAVNGENWSYLVISSTGSQLIIQSSVHALTLVPAEAGHPSHDEAVVGINNTSVWVVTRAVSGRS
jgi:hypothetical protein